MELWSLFLPKALADEGQALDLAVRGEEGSFRDVQMTTDASKTEMIDAFSNLPWHDSKFLGWNVAYDDNGEAVVTFAIDFGKAEIVTGRAELEFHDCRGFYSEVDLLAKKLCGDQIASGYGEDAEESGAAFVQRLTDRFDLYRGESVSGLFVFSVKLIHPGGEFLVIARSFSLSQGKS